MSFFQQILTSMKGITVFALVGGSGTGKSFRAKLLAQKYNIEALIDDGLLIQDDKILAGHSAKREKTFLAAVRVAVFDDKSHRDEIAKAIKKYNLKRILILGTSEKMVNKIANRIQMPEPTKIIKIEDIASKEDIEKAIRSRHVEGKHVIPVPSLEIKRSYPQIFYDSIVVKLAKKTKLITPNNTRVFEKSVVRPEFSQKGRVSISESALSQMVMHCVSEFDTQIIIKKITIKTTSQGYKIILTTDIPFGSELAGKIHNLQKYLIENIERFTGIYLEEVNIVVDKIRV